ncbi:MAG TPA: DNA gyrase inhibitor YacG [Polyangiaceae bacterium]
MARARVGRGMLAGMWIECPECRAKLEVPANHPTRPFCSSRCKLIDLGRWFSEEVRVTGQSRALEFDGELPAESNMNQDVD